MPDMQTQFEWINSANSSGSPLTRENLEHTRDMMRNERMPQSGVAIQILHEAELLEFGLDNSTHTATSTTSTSKEQDKSTYTPKYSVGDQIVKVEGPNRTLLFGTIIDREVLAYNTFYGVLWEDKPAATNCFFSEEELNARYGPELVQNKNGVRARLDLWNKMVNIVTDRGNPTDDIITLKEFETQLYGPVEFDLSELSWGCEEA